MNAVALGGRVGEPKGGDGHAAALVGLGVGGGLGDAARVGGDARRGAGGAAAEDFGEFLGGVEGAAALRGGRGIGARVGGHGDGLVDDEDGWALLVELCGSEQDV